MPCANTVDAAANTAALLATFKKEDKTARITICTTVERKPLEMLLSCTKARENVGEVEFHLQFKI